jgi:hypothetical protein
MKIHKKFLSTVGFIFLLGGASLFASEQSAVDILNKAYQYVGSMDKYAFNAVVIDDDVEDGKIIKQKYRHDVSVKVDRPGKLRVDTKGDIRNRSNYLNDGMFTMMDHTFGYYAQLQTPKTIDGTLDLIFEIYGIRAPLAQIVYSDMNKRFKFKKSKNFGTMMVNGTECNYVAFSDDTAEVHIWIETGDKPLLKAYTIFDKTIEGYPALSTSITWQETPNISDNDFIFSAPKDAVEISVISAI